MADEWDELLAKLNPEAKDDSAEKEGEGFLFSEAELDKLTRATRRKKRWNPHNNLRFNRIDPRTHKVPEVDLEAGEVVERDSDPHAEYDPSYDHGLLKSWHSEAKYQIDEGASPIGPNVAWDPKAPKPEPATGVPPPMRSDFQKKRMNFTWKYRNFKHCRNCGAFDTYESYRPDETDFILMCYQCGAKDMKCGDLPSKYAETEDDLKKKRMAKLRRTARFKMQRNARHNLIRAALANGPKTAWNILAWLRENYADVVDQLVSDSKQNLVKVEILDLPSTVYYLNQMNKANEIVTDDEGLIHLIR